MFDADGGRIDGRVLWCGLRRVAISRDFSRNVFRLSVVSGKRVTVGGVIVSRIVVTDGFGSSCEFSFQVFLD